MNKKTCAALRAIRKERGYTMPQVEKLLSEAGCPAAKSSISRWEMGHSNPSIEQFIALCRIYHVRDVIRTFADGTVIPFRDGLNEAGRKKLEEHRQLLIASGLYQPDINTNVVELPRRTIVHYALPASAGHGVFLDSEDYQQVEVGPEVPLTATFGVPISGDSMEPEYRSGDSVWIHQQQTLESGEIGLFMLNGQAFLKQFRIDNGQYRLISLNPEYPPMQIGEADTFRVLGKAVATTPRP